MIQVLSSEEYYEHPAIYILEEPLNWEPEALFWELVIVVVVVDCHPPWDPDPEAAPDPPIESAPEDEPEFDDEPKDEDEEPAPDPDTPIKAQSLPEMA